MRKQIISVLLVTFFWTTGLIFGTTSFPPKIAPHVKKVTLTEMERKNDNRRIAKSYAWAGWGWKGEEWVCLEELWSIESRFDNLAKNQSGSSAYGIAQLLGEKSHDTRVQVLRGLRYISKRHESPCGALRHELRYNWY